MKRIFILTILCSLISISFAQWTQKGLDIDGEEAQGFSGRSISMSDNGNTIAIGAPYNDGAATNAGHVRVYEWSGTSWTQKGADIDGEAAEDISGWSVSINGDGSTVAIGAEGNDGTANNAGHVRVYDWSGTAWTQKGNDIDGEAAFDFSSRSISISSDGNTLAIGAPGNDNAATWAGNVRIFEWSGTAWTQKGASISGEAANDQSGHSVSISSDGNTIAIGAPYNDGSASNSGHVRVYQWSGTSWTQKGSDINGESTNDQSGSSVSISADGNTVAIGAPFNGGGGAESGHTRVYRWNGSGWTQKGSDINGEAANDQSGYAVSISADGNTMIIGAPNNSGIGTDAGHARIYQWDGASWNQAGTDIDGEDTNDQSGYAVSVNSYGNTVATGAIYNDGGGTWSGHVRVYQILGVDIEEDNLYQEISIYPNPSDGVISIDLGQSAEITYLSITDILGNCISSGNFPGQFCNLQFDAPSGVYLLNLAFQDTKKTFRIIKK